MAKPCPDCRQPMTWFLTGWKCMNVKAHARSRHGGSKGNNPTGVNKWTKTRRVPPKPKKKGPWVLTQCPTCENGRRFNPKRCRACGGYGRMWTIR